MCSIGAVFSVASMGVGVFGQMQQMRAMKQQQAAQQAMYEAQRRQQEEQAKAAMLATNKKYKIEKEKRQDFLNQIEHHLRQQELILTHQVLVHFLSQKKKQQEEI